MIIIGELIFHRNYETCWIWKNVTLKLEKAAVSFTTASQRATKPFPISRGKTITNYIYPRCSHLLIPKDGRMTSPFIRFPGDALKAILRHPWTSYHLSRGICDFCNSRYIEKSRSAYIHRFQENWGLSYIPIRHFPDSSLNYNLI